MNILRRLELTAVFFMVLGFVGLTACTVTVYGTNKGFGGERWEFQVRDGRGIAVDIDATAIEVYGITQVTCLPSIPELTIEAKLIFSYPPQTSRDRFIPFEWAEIRPCTPSQPLHE